MKALLPSLSAEEITSPFRQQQSIVSKPKESPTNADVFPSREEGYYERYCQFCERLGQAPLSYSGWHLRTSSTLRFA